MYIYMYVYSISEHPSNCKGNRDTTQKRPSYHPKHHSSNSEHHSNSNATTYDYITFKLRLNNFIRPKSSNVKIFPVKLS